MSSNCPVHLIELTPAFGIIGCKHNFITTSGTPLVLFTVYAPAEHNEKTIHKTKEEGDELEEAGKVSTDIPNSTWVYSSLTI